MFAELFQERPNLVIAAPVVVGGCHQVPSHLQLVLHNHSRHLQAYADLFLHVCRISKQCKVSQALSRGYSNART